MSTQAAQRKTPAPKTGADKAVSAEPVRTEDTAKTEGGPALSLAGLHFFIADISRKTILWHESASQSFHSEIKDLQQAPSAEALRLLTPEDRKNILRLVQGAIKDGKAGPYDVGGGPDHRIPGIPLMAYRYEMPDGRLLAICFPSLGEGDANPGNVVLGLAPILQHFVANSNRVVLLVDNFGYVRFASEAFVQHFRISDARLILGRNIAHVQNRVGRTLVSLTIAALTRRASATGRTRFLLPSSESVELSYDAMYFRIGGNVGGVLFSAGQIGGDVDFSKVFDLCSSAMVVVNTNTRMIVAANKSAMKAYGLTPEIMDVKPITETLLHPRSYSNLLDSAKQGSEVPMSVVVNALNGQSKKKRLKASLIDTTKVPKLVLEARA
ncbi:hypothetical protein JM93_01011 [Roseibium hamelinense]|uniref:PAS domain-containing protein n=1 Tax=Roseibium hamelinense TaxID=150831 RepID=A0A562T936_9HYPH|nr:PAS domain-containing protein [Roseibium hamelinense]TWI90035.1 hypothetical protein JM93_01011 [Roseibium hamelinense]